MPDNLKSQPKSGTKVIFFRVVNPFRLLSDTLVSDSLRMKTENIKLFIVYTFLKDGYYLL
jgi:hypothetical protein